MTTKSYSVRMKTDVFDECKKLATNMVGSDLTSTDVLLLSLNLLKNPVPVPEIDINLSDMNIRLQKELKHRKSVNNNLQSVNEYLQTENKRLQTTVESLNNVNNNLQNEYACLQNEYTCLQNVNTVDSCVNKRLQSVNTCLQNDAEPTSSDETDAMKENKFCYILLAKKYHKKMRYVRYNPAEFYVDIVLKYPGLTRVYKAWRYGDYYDETDSKTDSKTDSADVYIE